jgi:hypothetical protein
MDIMTHAHNIPKTHLSREERGIPEHSQFRVFFADGSSVCESEANWSDMSEEVIVGYFGSQRLVRLCTQPVVRIEAEHGGITDGIDVPEGGRVYQSIRGQAFILANGRQDRIVGRYIGIVKDGEVIEEKYLDGLQLEVRGMRK